MKTTLAVIVMIFLGLAVLPLLAKNEKPGQGDKIGVVVRINEQGRLWRGSFGFISLCKTWEGQLIRGGLDDGSGAFGVAPFDFTVPTNELAEKVKHYMLAQTEVVVKFSTDYIYFKCNSESSGNFLISIEPIKDAAKNKNNKLKQKEEVL